MSALRIEAKHGQVYLVDGHVTLAQIFRWRGVEAQLQAAQLLANATYVPHLADMLARCIPQLDDALAQEARALLDELHPRETPCTTN